MVEQATGDATEVEVTFDDMTVLSEGGVDVFLLNWNQPADPPPFYIDVAERRFSYASETFLLAGHGAAMVDQLREHEAEGRTPLLLEREGRYYLFLHDPAVEAEDEASDEATEEAADESADGAEESDAG
ncbi:MAG: hypothetical protein V3R95_09765 [Dehalococcoidia bacterium]